MIYQTDLESLLDMLKKFLQVGLTFYFMNFLFCFRFHLKKEYGKICHSNSKIILLRESLLTVLKFLLKNHSHLSLSLKLGPNTNIITPGKPLLEFHQQAVLLSFQALVLQSVR